MMQNIFSNLYFQQKTLNYFMVFHMPILMLGFGPT